MGRTRKPTRTTTRQMSERDENYWQQRAALTRTPASDVTLTSLATLSAYYKT